MSVEKYFDKTYPDFDHGDFADEWVQKREEWKKDMVEFAEAYASHEKERMLNVSEEEIEEIIYNHCMGNWEKSNGVMAADEVDVSAAAKALLNHLKQEK